MLREVKQQSEFRMACLEFQKSVTSALHQISGLCSRPCGAPGFATSASSSKRGLDSPPSYSYFPSRQSVVAIDLDAETEDHVEQTAPQLASFLRSQRHRAMSWRQHMELFLDEPTTSIPALVYSWIMLAIIVASVLITLFDQTLKSRYQISDSFFDVADIFFTAVFTLEVVLRFCANSKWRYFFVTLGHVTTDNFFNIVDTVSIAPFYVQLIMGSGGLSRLLTLLRPTLRLMKVSRNFSGFELLLRSIVVAIPQLPVPLFLLMMICILFGSIMWHLEGDDSIPVSDDNPFGTIPRSMWFAIVTVSTVGYGDQSPSTDAGKIVAAIMIVVGVLYLAMPLGIVGNAFSAAWDARHEIAVLSDVRKRMKLLGIDAVTFDHAFAAVDTDQSGTIEGEEMGLLLQSLGAGSLSNSQIRNLVQLVDEDDDGGVSRSELAKAVLHPREYIISERMRRERQAREIEIRRSLTAARRDAEQLPDYSGALRRNSRMSTDPSRRGSAQSNLPPIDEKPEVVVLSGTDHDAQCAERNGPRHLQGQGVLAPEEEQQPQLQPQPQPQPQPQQQPRLAQNQDQQPGQQPGQQPEQQPSRPSSPPPRPPEQMQRPSLHSDASPSHDQVQPPAELVSVDPVPSAWTGPDVVVPRQTRESCLGRSVEGSPLRPPTTSTNRLVPETVVSERHGGRESAGACGWMGACGTEQTPRASRQITGAGIMSLPQQSGVVRRCAQPPSGLSPGGGAWAGRAQMPRELG